MSNDNTDPKVEITETEPTTEATGPAAPTFLPPVTAIPSEISDANMKIILSAFQTTPEQLPTAITPANPSVPLAAMLPPPFNSVGQAVQPTVKVKLLTPTATLPTRATPKAAGLDLYADEGIAIPSRGRYVMKTGVALSLPEGYEGQVRPRSGLAAKEGVTVLNAPGTIDQDYNGEILVILYNSGWNAVEICRGDRIAQLVVAPVSYLDAEQVDELPTTLRGANGLGSTGK